MVKETREKYCRKKNFAKSYLKIWKVVNLDKHLPVLYEISLKNPILRANNKCFIIYSLFIDSYTILSNIREIYNIFHNVLIFILKFILINNRVDVEKQI